MKICDFVHQANEDALEISSHENGNPKDLVLEAIESVPEIARNFSEKKRRRPQRRTRTLGLTEKERWGSDEEEISDSSEDFTTKRRSKRGA